MNAPILVEHFFRHEYGTLVATLCRRVGAARLESVEDAVQSALLLALQSWPATGVPQQPTAWLFRVAHNTLIDGFRLHTRHAELLQAHGSNDLSIQELDSIQLGEHELTDDLLRMLFVCCDDAIPLPSQLVLALKTLCGFDVREIASRLFVSEASIYKRLLRAREHLRELPLHTDDDLTGAQYRARLPAVRAVLYLLFTEGYLSSQPDLSIRRELCEEAIRLTSLLAQHEAGADPETFALLALMHLHAARLLTRQDSAGCLLLLEEQNRSAWDARHIECGMLWLARSAQGNRFSRYHVEAGIAAEYCLAPTFRETRWDRVAEGHAKLEHIAPSAWHRLNRAVAVAEWRGAAAGLEVLHGFEPPLWLVESYLWPAVASDLHLRAGNLAAASVEGALAIERAPTTAIRDALRRRLGPAIPTPRKRE